MAHLAVSLLLMVCSLTSAQTVQQPHSKATLVASHTAAKPGERVLVGLRLELERGWHVYWRNPGDSGEPIHIDWELPETWEAGEPLWPTPQRIEVPPLVNYGYENEAWLLTELTVGSTLDRQAPIRAHATWLVCEETCIPAKASFKLLLHVTSDASASSPEADRLTAMRAEIPAPSPDWQASARAVNKTLELDITGPTQGVTGALFFPYSETLIQSSAPQTVEIGRDHLTLKVALSPFSPDGQPDAASLPGVLVLQGETPAAVEIAPLPTSSFGLFWKAILFAFLGGALLNLMPCVFPVLCLKVLSFVSLTGKKRKSAMSHAAAYTGGIVVSFWILATSLIVLRSAGQALGWGFQLQSPVFLGALVFLLVGFGLSLFGVFEVGGGWTGAGQKLAAKGGLAGAFFSGVLATIVATPCTAPFMGSAMGFALSQPAAASLAVFTMLGLGIASPYVVFSYFPALTKRLPKPGPWMITFKQLMGFPLILTAWWLLSVLALQASVDAVFHTLLGLVFFSLGLWIWGQGKPSRLWVKVLGLVLCLGAAAFALNEIRTLPTGENVPRSAGVWDAFSEPALKEARASGQPVFIDFTAAWCITCQVNKRVALDKPAVLAAFEEKGVKLFRADWTNQNEEIAKRLESYGRNGVPLYVLYPAGENSEPRLLPQVLTPEVVIGALNALP